MEKIVIIGGGGHAKVIISLLHKLNQYDVIGYTDTADRGSIFGVKYLGDDAQLEGFKNEEPNCLAVLGVGSIDVSHKRLFLKERLNEYGFSLATVVSPYAVVNEGVKIGAGTVVLDGAIIQAGTHIGECAIINTASVVDHDCRLGNFVHIASGATVCGGVKIGDHSFIGAGSTIIQYKTIGENCLIGAGTTVIDDCLTQGLYIGTPAVFKTGTKRI